jgi:hypothetical protein
MSEVSGAAEAATGANVGEAQKRVVDEADKHTPAPSQPPVVEHVPEPPKVDDGLDQLKDTVSELATTVANLAALVTGETVKDESPAKVPWTHRGFGGGHE